VCQVCVGGFAWSFFGCLEKKKAESGLDEARLIYTSGSYLRDSTQGSVCLVPAHCAIRGVRVPAEGKSTITDPIITTTQPTNKQTDVWLPQMTDHSLH